MTTEKLEEIFKQALNVGCSNTSEINLVMFYYKKWKEEEIVKELQSWIDRRDVGYDDQHD